MNDQSSSGLKTGLPVMLSSIVIIVLAMMTLDDTSGDRGWLRLFLGLGVFVVGLLQLFNYLTSRNPDDTYVQTPLDLQVFCYAMVAVAQSRGTIGDRDKQEMIRWITESCLEPVSPEIVQAHVEEGSQDPHAIDQFLAYNGLTVSSQLKEILMKTCAGYAVSLGELDPERESDLLKIASHLGYPRELITEFVKTTDGQGPYNLQRQAL